MLCVRSMMRLTTLTVSCSEKVLGGGTRACVNIRRIVFCLSFSFPPSRPDVETHLEQVLLNLAMVDGTVAPPVELDQVPVVVDKGDKVQVGVGFEGGSLQHKHKHRHRAHQAGD